jgi:phosphotransferase system  glucose/maltose/N-acetylglucosamine-specific IIC component
MQNPFETGQIKNYLLFYVGIVAIMVLFFIATTLFHDTKDIEKKVFGIEQNSIESTDTREKEEQDPAKSRFKLLDKTY